MFGFETTKPRTARSFLETERRGIEKEIARREAAIAERDAETSADREQITYRKLELEAIAAALGEIAEEAH